MVETIEEATVDCLIDEGTRKWNVEMIDGIFAPQEAEEIKNIPLASKDTKDSLFWPLENDGSYSCKMGYRFLKEDEGGHQVDVQQNHEKGLWNKIWALDCPNKVRNLIWRACHNSSLQSATYFGGELFSSNAVIAARQKMKTLFTRSGAAECWTTFGVRITHGIFEINNTFQASVSSWLGFSIIKGIRHCLHSPFGPFGIRGINHGLRQPIDL